MEKNVPIWLKYTLSISEASAYYGIGEKRLRNMRMELIKRSPLWLPVGRLLVPEKTDGMNIFCETCLSSPK